MDRWTSLARDVALKSSKVKKSTKRFGLNEDLEDHEGWWCKLIRRYRDGYPLRDFAGPEEDG